MEATASTDYSDFEYQHFDFEHNIPAGPSDNNTRSEARGDLTPLEGIGGLDVNEVAELVAVELQARIELENEEGNQSKPSAVEFRGAMGANLPNEGGIGSSQIGKEVDGEIIVDRNGESFARFNNTVVEDRIFQLFNADAGFPFDDDVNGNGGSGFTDNFYAVKNFRNLTGRGPVLDSSDDISVISTLNASDQAAGVAGHVRASLIWDTAEVSDAGRAFSVPSDD